MSNSVQTVVSNGSLTLLDLSINYLDRAHIKVSFNAVEQTLGTTWAWVGTTDKKIQFTPAVSAGVVVQVKRQTPLDAPRHVFSSPGNAPFNKSTVDENFQQTLYASQEAAEGASLQSFAQDVSAAGHKLTDLGDATLEGDAVSLKVLREYLPYGPAAASLDARLTAEEAVSAALVDQGVLGGSLVITGFDATGLADRAVVHFAGRDTVDDGAGGQLRFLAGSTMTADGGTVYAVPGGRLVREGWSVFGIRPEWFGSTAGNIKKAVDALPAYGGLVLLGDRVYPPSYTDYTGTAGVGYLAKANVRIQGSKTPKAKSDLTGLEGGTIIQGPFFVFADGFEVDKIGVDSGAVVCDSLYGGVAQEGFVHFKPGQSTVTPAANTVTVGDIVAITQSFSAPVHSILLEGIDNLQFSNLRSYLGTHGVVIKSKNVNGTNVFTKGNSSDGLICKSDAYANMMHVNIQNVLVEAVSDALEAGFGVLVEAVGAVGGQVNIGNIRAYKKNVALSMRSNGNAMNDINVTNVISEGCTTGVQYGGDIRRTHVGSLIANNFGQAVYVATEVISATNSIGVVKATNGVHVINSDGRLSIGHIDADNVSGQMFYYGNTGVRLSIGTYTQASAPNVWALDQTLLNGWVNHVPEGGNSQFSVLPWAGKVVLSGLIAGGTSAIIANLSVQVRPTKNLRFTALGYTGGTNKWVPIEIIIGTDGNITATNYTDAPGYISLDGIEFPIPL